MTKADKRWLAGVIDCEGCIQLQRLRQNGGITYTIRVSVGNTKKRLPDTLKRLTGAGNVYRYNKQPPRKTSYIWQLSRHSDVKRVVRDIRPYLILKGRQADLILRYPAWQVHKPALKQRLWVAVRALNKKGI